MSEPENWPDGQPVTPWADPWHDIAGDLAGFYLLQDSLIQMPTELPSQRRERERAYRESGQLTRELIARLLAGEFW